MPLTLEAVKYIANLARLQLDEAEESSFREQLSAILDYAARLKDLDTSGIAPTSSVLKSQSVLRDDDPRPGLTTEEVFYNAPKAENGQFRVPLVLE
jgi:aspartyl-tRNA(Asn)/glutamyl-tRNA(Gln) amidotransferase subunit C